MGRLLGRAVLCTGAAAGLFFLPQSTASAAEESTGAGQPPVSAGNVLSAAGQQIPAPVASSLTNENGDIGIGDARPSTSAEQAPPPGTTNPPPNRADVDQVPRAGVGFNPETSTVRWSYDVKPPVNSNQFTEGLPAPHVPVQRLLPGDFGAVQNHASHLDEDNRTADGQRHPSDPNNPAWNLTTTDLIVPGYARVLRFDMVCPNHSGWTGNGGMKHDTDESYTGASKYDLDDGHLVFSYQWGDNLVNNEFIEGHYLAYGLSNDS